MRRYLHICLLLLLPYYCVAQCSDWSVSSKIIAQSNCVASGSFEIELQGSDAPNLSSIQYGIAAPPGGGLSVPLNNSPIFTGIPAGQYEVSVVGYCGGSFVGKTTTVNIQGVYTPPEMTATVTRNSFSCLNTGVIRVNPQRGQPPYVISILQAPASYTGPRTLNVNSAGNYYFGSLPPGSYRVQVSDACGTGTNPNTLSVEALNPSNIQLTSGSNAHAALGCSTVSIALPIPSSSGSWAGYPDTFYTITAEIPGVTASGSQRLGIGSVLVSLLPGKSVKDCYGQQIHYHITPVCGAPFSTQRVFPEPRVVTSVKQNCNIDFSAEFSITSNICYPVTYSFLHRSSGTTLGPYTYNGGTVPFPALSFGVYDITFTTADGYTGAGMMEAAPLPTSPYRVAIRNTPYETPGLNGYIDGFTFTSSHTPRQSRTVELFSGPAGYVASVVWSPNVSSQNILGSVPVTASTLRFPPGNYVWKITEECGVYYVPIEVTPTDAPAQSARIIGAQETCLGREITLSGTRRRLGRSEAVAFNVYELHKDLGLVIGSLGQTENRITLTTPGRYLILPTKPANTNSALIAFPSGPTLPYPNMYTNGVIYDYGVERLAVKRDQTQGFACNSNGAAEIHAKGTGGFPFSGPSPYTYSLARAGSGRYGPFISTNSTGIFTGFGGRIGEKYDVRIEDSCGGYVVQEIEILDLTKTRLISSDKYILCDSARVQLYTIPLPGASYTWTGPNGFTSNLPDPVIDPIVASRHAGVYKVTVSIPQCSVPFTDSTIITSNVLPPVPDVEIICDDPIHLLIKNPMPGIQYRWREREYYYGAVASEQIRSSNVGQYGYQPTSGRYIGVVATDLSSRCISYSGEIPFLRDTRTPFRAEIEGNKFHICPGEFTNLYAAGFTDPGLQLGQLIRYQWLFNNVPIPGATGRVYTASNPGSYRVFVQLDTCQRDTSAAVEIAVIQAPTGNVTTDVDEVCEGEVARLSVPHTNNYHYSWYRNGVVIPGANAAAYSATETGDYFVVIANAGCIKITDTIPITVYRLPAASIIRPNTDTTICDGTPITIVSDSAAKWRYRWFYNENLVAGETRYQLVAARAGQYRVAITSDFCPGSDTSMPVEIFTIPTRLGLMDDTVICGDKPFSIVLDAGADFHSFVWSTGARGRTIVVNQPGRWYVSAANECGRFFDTVYIRMESEYLPKFPADTTICNAFESGILRVPELMDNIRWSTGATTSFIEVREPGVYYVEGYSPCGRIYDSVNVRFCRPRVDALLLSADKICEGSCIEIAQSTSNFPQTFHWSFEGGTPAEATGPTPGKVCYAKPGVYPIKLDVTNAGGTTTETRYVNVAPIPVGRFADSVITLPYNSDLRLSPCGISERVDWYKNDSLICRDCPELSLQPKDWKALYACVLYNEPGCKDTCTYRVETTGIPSDIYLPTAFSPNGDGKNDRFGIVTDNPNIIVREFRVYNRWGNNVFQTFQSGNSWDGSHGGRPAETGTYYWMISYRVAGSERVYEMKGDVVLLR